MSNLLISESRTPRAMFSKSQNMAILRSCTSRRLSGTEMMISRAIDSTSEGEIT